MLKLENAPIRIEPLGRDNLGNIGGYRVVRGYGWKRQTLGTFPANGSLEEAKAAAHELAQQELANDARGD